MEGAHFQKKVLYSTPMLAAYLTMAIVALRIDNIPEVISQLPDGRLITLTGFCHVRGDVLFLL